MKNKTFLIIIIIVLVFTFVFLFLGTSMYEGYTSSSSSSSSSLSQPPPPPPPSDTTNSTTVDPSSSIEITSKVFYASNGTQATIITDDNNEIDSIIITNPETGTSVFIPSDVNTISKTTKTTTVTNTSNSNSYTISSTTYTDQNGNTATFKKDSSGNVFISVVYKSTGTVVIYTNTNTSGQYSNSSYNNNNYSTYPDSTTTSQENSNYTNYTNSSTPPPPPPSDSSSSSTSTTQPPPPSSSSQTQQPVVATNYDSTSYYNSKQGYNNGIPASQIPVGSEDLYILKSQIVDPVCPICPPSIIKTCKSEGKCPPCPAPQRCPSEGDFVCKKEPNYKSYNVQKYLPQPILNSFSSFGM